MTDHSEPERRRAPRWRSLATRAASGLAGLKLEVAALCLIAATTAAVVWQDSLLRRSTSIAPGSMHRYVGYGYGDEGMNGASRAVVDPDRPLTWACELRRGYQYPMCGYEILFDPPQNEQGRDFSNVENILLTFTYQGEADSLRLHLKNFDPTYSVPGRGETTKFNKIDFPVTSGRQTAVLPLGQFGVAEWWLTQNRISPALSQPQFDNVTSVDLQTAPGTALGTHRFQLERIVFEGRWLNAAQFYGGILGVWLLLVGSFVVFRITHLKDALKERERIQRLTLLEAERAREAARRDHLTGALNRAGAEERFQTMVSDAGCDSVAVILVDVDNFKLVNDQYGHAYGDDVLASLAQILARNIREADIVARWGGEEFIVICANLAEDETLALADKLRGRIEHFHFGECERITASFGAYWTAAGFTDLAPLVACADIALYAAKARGRNRAVRYDSFLRSAA